MDQLSTGQLCLLVHFIIFTSANTQLVTDSTEVTPPSDIAYNINTYHPSLGIIVGFLCIMFCLIIIFIIYIKYRQPPSLPTLTPLQIQDGLHRSTGIDKNVIESLPFFRFSLVKGSREGLECAVCLTRFEDIEILRLLPKCKHAFHINCIDQWLAKHSTCPLCRHKVSADDLSQMPYSNSFRFLWNQSELKKESDLELYVQREGSQRGSSRFSVGSSFRKLSDHSYKGKNEDELLMQENMDPSGDDKTSGPPLHKFNHRIVVNDVVLKNRWSSVSSSDLVFLNSEMLGNVSSERFPSSPKSRNNDGKKIAETKCDHDQVLRNIKEETERKRVFESKLGEIKKSDCIYNSFPSQELPTTSSSDTSHSFESKAMIDRNERRSMSEIVVHPRYLQVDQNNVEERRRRVWLPIARKTLQWFATRERRHVQSRDLSDHHGQIV